MCWIALYSQSHPVLLYRDRIWILFFCPHSQPINLLLKLKPWDNDSPRQTYHYSNGGDNRRLLDRNYWIPPGQYLLCTQNLSNSHDSILHRRSWGWWRLVDHNPTCNLRWPPLLGYIEFPSKRRWSSLPGYIVLQRRMDCCYSSGCTCLPSRTGHLRYLGYNW